MQTSRCINNDNISFNDETFQKVFNFYGEKIKKEELPSHQDFINNPDQDISQFSINILSNQHELSPNWETHKIFTVTEDKQLKKAVVNTLYAFKLSKLTQLILDNQEQLKIETSEAAHLKLLQEQLTLQQIKKQLAAKLGRIILK